MKLSAFTEIMVVTFMQSCTAEYNIPLRADAMSQFSHNPANSVQFEKEAPKQFSDNMFLPPLCSIPHSDSKAVGLHCAYDLKQSILPSCNMIMCLKLGHVPIGDDWCRSFWCDGVGRAAECSPLERDREPRERGPAITSAGNCVFFFSF
jgi:hypothetical protein